MKRRKNFRITQDDFLLANRRAVVVLPHHLGPSIRFFSSFASSDGAFCGTSVWFFCGRVMGLFVVCIVIGHPVCKVFSRMFKNIILHIPPFLKIGKSRASSVKSGAAW